MKRHGGRGKEEEGGARKPPILLLFFKVILHGDSPDGEGRGRGVGQAPTQSSDYRRLFFLS